MRDAVQVQRTVPLFRMFDIEKARGFYVDWLGFDWAGSHQHLKGAPVYAFLKLGGAEVLHLSEHQGDGTPCSAAMIFASGLRAWFEELRARPYAFYNPALQPQPWGLTCTLQDPFGNRLTFCDPEDRGTG